MVQEVARDLRKAVADATAAGVGKFTNDVKPVGGAPFVQVEAAKPAAEAAAVEMSVMGRDIVVTGNIDATVDLLIEGRVIGDVSCATLVLGPDSSIKGRIKADRVRVSGQVDGAIETVELAIEAGAHVKGDVSYSRIRIANGGVIEGSLAYKAGPADDAVEAKLKLVQPPEAAAPVHYFE